MYNFNTKEATEAGLRVWIAFVVGLWLIGGVRAELCVLLGAIAGLATYQIVSFWKAEPIDPKLIPPPEASEATTSTPLTPLEEVFRKPAERFRNWKLPRFRGRKPPKPPRTL